MHPVRRPALVHPAFENPAVSSGTNPHIDSGRTALLAEESRPDMRHLA